ncbi:cupin domain-containing protein [Pelosinus sp. sgz500959]|uniref:cupin domain-containing protein n=1 Tax=Pelosinus sp. sgz500959 TaxID=3242472 RepID=UPI00366B3272
MIITNQDVQTKKTGDKTSQKVLVAGDNIMLVEFYFDKGGIGVLHKHDDHEQIGYVAKGSFEITVANETKIAKQGDCYYAAKNVWHGVVALEDDSVLVDSFTPLREDFLTTSDK